ncbi:NnrS family protein [Halomonas rhizosphaerae]|uniref:NnrS family protein n=1 Tax=Halomonas rhizosphaerae TaxID=3043296 RepID=A0ABT6V758_9GAMM|nr:NnrS family protein [Halomonas rhizosphaerae]MDI5892777.1 NnrS family protein [Halomonas rhizosphaerae]
MLWFVANDTGQTDHTRRADRRPAWSLFFPLAALYAALAVPLSLAAMFGGLPALATPAAHGRELLFGFALAVIAGYLLGPLPPRRLSLLAGLWLVGRLGGLAGYPAWPLLLADAAFALLLAARLVSRFLAAKKWRNRLLSPLLGLLCLLAVASLAARPAFPGLLSPLLHQGVLWLLLLMAFMGGRVIAPAVNGHLMARDRVAGAGVQPRIEATLIGLLGAAGLLAIWPPLWPLAGVLLALAGMVILVRLWRWSPWRLRDRPDLLGLLLGYAWLGVGALLVAGDLLAGGSPAGRLHAMTVGALGTLASGIMLRQAILRARGRPGEERWLTPLALLFTLAAGLRLALPLAGLTALWGAAGAWSLAWLLVAWRLVHWRRRGTAVATVPSTSA